MSHNERAWELAQQLKSERASTIDMYTIVTAFAEIERAVLGRVVSVLKSHIAAIETERDHNASYSMSRPLNFSAGDVIHSLSKDIAAIRGLIDDTAASGTTASINTTGATYIIDVDGARRLKAEPAAPDPIYATFGDGERKVIGTNRPGGIVTTANTGDIILELQDRISELESPAAPDSTKALRQALKDLLSCYEVGHLSDENLEARDKSEPDHGYAECLRARIALRLAEDGG